MVRDSNPRFRNAIDGAVPVGYNLPYIAIQLSRPYYGLENIVKKPVHGYLVMFNTWRQFALDEHGGCDVHSFRNVEANSPALRHKWT